MTVKTLNDYTEQEIRAMQKKCPKFELVDGTMCLVDTAGLNKLIKEYNLFLNKKGYTYLQLLKETGCIKPDEQEFFRFYFTNWEEDFPNIVGTFKCTNSKVAERLGFLLAPVFETHDTFYQTYTEVEVDGTMVNIYSGDY